MFNCIRKIFKKPVFNEMLAPNDNQFRQRIADQLLVDEGYRPMPYKDTEGYWTIGIGRNLDTVGISQLDRRMLGISDDFMNEGVTINQAHNLLTFDIDRTIIKLRRFTPYKDVASEEAREILVNMAFNLGVDGLLKFKNTWNALSTDDYRRAANEMRDSLWFKQVGIRAERLIKRMEALA